MVQFAHLAVCDLFKLVTLLARPLIERRVILDWIGRIGVGLKRNGGHQGSAVAVLDPLRVHPLSARAVQFCKLSCLSARFRGDLAGNVVDFMLGEKVILGPRSSVKTADPVPNLRAAMRTAFGQIGGEGRAIWCGIGYRKKEATVTAWVRAYNHPQGIAHAPA